MLKNVSKYILIVVSISIIMLATDAKAELFGFGAITNNSGVSYSYDNQLAVDITQYSSNEVKFVFYNYGPASPYTDGSPIAGAINEIYFDDTANVLDGLNTTYGFQWTGTYVNYEYSGTATSPADLPGGGTFVATQSLSIQSDSITQAPNDGVNPSETLSVVYYLESGKTYEQFLTALYDGFDGLDTFRIGIHVRGILPDTLNESDSFIMTPLPGAVLLGILGLGMAGIKLRKYA